MFKKLLLASALFLGAATASQATVLFSDNFNTDPQGLNTTPNGWVIDFGSVDTIGTGFYEFYTGNGNYIDTNGSTGTDGGFHTAQTFNLMAGRTYTISFDYGNNQGLPDTSFSSLLFGFDIGNSIVFAQGLVPNLLHAVFSFTASQDSTEHLQFAALTSDPALNGGIILDNVSLSVVPVPAALPLFAAGLGVLGVAGRRRRNKTAA